MDTIFILLIIILILCSLSSSIGAYFFKKKNEQEVYLYNKNIDDYNIKYNINFENNKIYYQNDFKNMYKAIAKVISDSIEKTIVINNTPIKIYTTIIEYDIINYISEDTEKINSENEGKIILKKENNVIFDNKIRVIAEIITKVPLDTSMMFSVYYNYDIDRIAPPFISDKNVLYLNKKNPMFG
jgi:hypothetical protein